MKKRKKNITKIPISIFQKKEKKRKESIEEIVTEIFLKKKRKNKKRISSHFSQKIKIKINFSVFTKEQK